MRRIQRLAIESASEKALAKLQASVDGSANPKTAAETSWKRKTSTAPRKKAFLDVRAKLKKMSTGLQRCMYCEDSEGTDIDHFRPRSLFPQFTFQWVNYLHACSHCNSNEKRAQFPIAKKGPLLLDPTSDDPYVHLQFVWQTGRFVGQTPRGDKTVEVFGLNRREVLERGRRNTWIKLESLLETYRTSVDAGQRSRIVEVVRELPFQAVVQHFLRDALAGKSNVPPAIAQTVQRSKADWTWAL